MFKFINLSKKIRQHKIIIICSCILLVETEIKFTVCCERAAPCEDGTVCSFPRFIKQEGSLVLTAVTQTDIVGGSDCLQGAEFHTFTIITGEGLPFYTEHVYIHVRLTVSEAPE